MKKHNETIDITRCLLIALMVFVHVVNFGDRNPGVKDAILSFMMPTFLVITGYLVNVRKSVGGFLNYLLQLFLPYVIMVSGYMVMSLYLPVRDGITTLDAATVCRVLFVTSIGPYWFLRVMMVCGLCYYLVYRLLASRSEAMRFSLLAALLIVLSVYTPLMSIRCAAYYLMGVGIRHFLHDFSRVCLPDWWPAIPLVLILMQTDWYDWGSLSTLASVWCFLSIASWTDTQLKGRWRSALRYIGSNTLPIYLFHPIFTMVSKWLLPCFRFEPSGTLHALFTVALAIAGSLAIARMMDATRLSWLFGKARILR